MPVDKATGIISGSVVAVKVSVVVPVWDTDTVVGAVSTTTATEPKGGA